MRAKHMFYIILTKLYFQSCITNSDIQVGIIHRGIHVKSISLYPHCTGATWIRDTLHFELHLLLEPLKITLEERMIGEHDLDWDDLGAWE